MRAMNGFACRRPTGAMWDRTVAISCVGGPQGAGGLLGRLRGRS